MSGNSPILSFAEVLKATGGVALSGLSETKFYGISTDSRQVCKGNIFIALTGENFDGHDFINKALTQGAAGILIENEAKIDLAGMAKNVVVIKVADTLRALGNMAKYYRSLFTIPVIGLTGSSGKTTTKEMMAAIMGLTNNVLKTEGNLNNLIGLPQTIFRLSSAHQVAILEMGTNTRGEIKRLTEIAAPNIGLITNIGPAHLAGFGSLNIVQQEKGDLFFNMEASGTAVINQDDEAMRNLAEKWPGKRITFGMGSDAEVTVTDVKKNGARGVCFNLQIGEQVQKVEMKIAGIHHVYNALAAAATAKALGIGMDVIKEGLSSFRPVSGRMEMIKLQNGAFLLDDSYNANPASVREALMTLKDLKNHHCGYVFLGDMLELGDASDEMHRKIGTLMATIGVNAAFLKGDFAAMTASGAIEGGMSRQNIFFLSDDEEGISYLKKHLKKSDWILVKGSRRLKMEKIVAQICENFGGEKIVAGNGKPANQLGVQN